MITMRSAWLGKIRQHRQGDSPREAVETLASGKKLWLIAKMNPQMERPRSRLVRNARSLDWAARPLRACRFARDDSFVGELRRGTRQQR
jgi:hypothetical protein